MVNNIIIQAIKELIIFSPLTDSAFVSRYFLVLAIWETIPQIESIVINK